MTKEIQKYEEMENSGWSGALFLLKNFDEVKKEFVPIGGMRTTKMMLNRNLVDASSKNSGRWRKLLENAGITSISISASGIFTDSKAERNLRHKAFYGGFELCQLEFGNGDLLTCKFQITSYERSGDYDGEEIYSFSMESSGEIQFEGK